MSSVIFRPGAGEKRLADIMEKSLKSFQEKIIALVGVSDNPEKYGYKIFRDLLKNGFYVFGLNSRGGTVLGREIYKNLKDLPKIPDLVVTVVPAVVTEKIVEQCHELGIKEIWMQPGSDSRQAVERAKDLGIHATYHDCIMVHLGLW